MAATFRPIFWAAFGFLMINGMAMAANEAPKPASKPDNLSDYLLANAIHRKAPDKLFEQSNNDWPGGHFGVTVFKNGMPQVESTAQSLFLKLPIKVSIAGQTASEMLQFKMQCSAMFNTIAEIRVKPASGAKGFHPLQSSIELPVPPVLADCDGVEFPIEATIKALVQQYKPQWERKVDEELNGLSKPIVGLSAE